MHPMQKIRNPEDIEYICKLHAEGLPWKKVAETVLEERPHLKEKGVNSNNVRMLIKSPTNKHLIEKHKQQYYANFMDVDIAHKKVRLLDMDAERVRLKRSIDAICGRNGLVPAKGWTKYTTLLKRLIELEVLARDEVEKRPDLLSMLSDTGPMTEQSTEELLEYDRKLTFEIEQYRNGRRISAVAETKVADRQGVEGEDKSESPEILLAAQR
ncbi:MAG: hypothetical protein U9R01_02250 [candidate division WOR-3 bacterium]|nr:hypothetical protein [candidate division WOR-3 bacterium]